LTTYLPIWRRKLPVLLISHGGELGQAAGAGARHVEAITTAATLIEVPPPAVFAGTSDPTFSVIVIAIARIAVVPGAPIMLIFGLLRSVMPQRATAAVLLAGIALAGAVHSWFVTDAVLRARITHPAAWKISPGVNLIDRGSTLPHCPGQRVALSVLVSKGFAVQISGE
jgi:hypothetical protein